MAIRNLKEFPEPIQFPHPDYVPCTGYTENEDDKNSCKSQVRSNAHGLLECTMLLDHPMPHAAHYWEYEGQPLLATWEGEEDVVKEEEEEEESEDEYPNICDRCEGEFNLEHDGYTFTYRKNERFFCGNECFTSYLIDEGINAMEAK